MTLLDLSTVELLFGHTSEDSARLVDDYPYGRRVRTQIRYWIESKAGKGDRFCAQTLNPATDRWNKPKRSTYTGVGVMYVEPDSGHIKWTGIDFNCTVDRLAAFIAAVGVERLNDLQRARLAEIVGYTRAMSRVTFSVRPSGTPEENAAADAEQQVQERRLAQLIAAETALAGRALAP